MSFSYDLSTSVGQLRLNIGDTDADCVVFTDEELTAMLNASSGDVNQATGRALLTIANNAARLAKIKKAGNYSEDTTKIAADLRAQAKTWFELAVEPYDDVMEQTFGSVEAPYESPGEQQFIQREDLRNS